MKRPGLLKHVQAQMWKRGGMIAICKHLCRGVDGKGIVRGEKMIHSFAFFFFFFFFWFADESDAAVFVPSQLYCSFHCHTNVSGQNRITTQPPPPTPFQKCFVTSASTHVCIHCSQWVFIDELVLSSIDPCRFSDHKIALLSGVCAPSQW